MELSRRDIFKIGGKLLVLASAGATLERDHGRCPAFRKLTVGRTTGGA